ncbi:FAD-dependent oxidoreductase [Chloroflexota bacterium]
MAKPRIIVVGGGFSGCGAAITAAKVGAEVMLLERMDMLSGAGLRAGRMNYNGKMAIAEEAKAMGAGDIFEALESITLHQGNIVDEEGAYIYDFAKVDPAMQKIVRDAGVEVRLGCRAADVVKEDGVIKEVILDGGERLSAAAFIDCSGGTGGIDICTKYGGGCPMCLFKCPAFGNRVSIATKAGALEVMFVRPDGTPGGATAATQLYKESLSLELRRRLDKEGAFSIQLPKELFRQDNLSASRSKSQFEHLNLVDSGLTCKLVGSGRILLDTLRSIPGFEKAVFENPWGGRFSKIGHVSMTPRDDSQKVKGFQNLFVGGEKSGPGGGGIAEAIVTGITAGNNAVRQAVEAEPLILPRDCVIGDYSAYTGEMLDTWDAKQMRASVGHGHYFERMKKLGFYPATALSIHKRIQDLGLKGILAKKVI